MIQVQLDIRTGHQQTVDKVLAWLDEEGGVKGTTVCDAGCGTGSLSLPLALRVSPTGPVPALQCGAVSNHRKLPSDTDHTSSLGSVFHELCCV